jgi:transcription termination/antitermination protein NusG
MYEFNGQAAETEKRWYALYVKSRHEKFVSNFLRENRFEEFLPLYRSSRKWSDRTAKVEMPLFPGYLFCRFPPEMRNSILAAPGVVTIVGNLRVPTPVDENEIADLRRVLASGRPIETVPFLRTGQRVRITEGALEGLEGYVVSLKTPRLVISVTLLQRSVALEIECERVVPCGGEHLQVMTGHTKPLVQVAG